MTKSLDYDKIGELTRRRAEHLAAIREIEQQIHALLGVPLPDGTLPQPAKPARARRKDAGVKRERPNVLSGPWPGGNAVDGGGAARAAEAGGGTAGSIPATGAMPNHDPDRIEPDLPGFLDASKRKPVAEMTTAEIAQAAARGEFAGSPELQAQHAASMAAAQKP